MGIIGLIVGLIRLYQTVSGLNLLFSVSFGLLMGLIGLLVGYIGL